MAFNHAVIALNEQQRVTKEQRIRASVGARRLSNLLFNIAGNDQLASDPASEIQTNHLVQVVEAAFEGKDKKKPLTVKVPKAVMADIPIITEQSFAISLLPRLEVKDFRVFTQEIDEEPWVGKFKFSDSLVISEFTGGLMLDRRAMAKAALLYSRPVGVDEINAPMLEVSAVTQGIEAYLNSGVAN